MNKIIRTLALIALLAPLGGCPVITAAGLSTVGGAILSAQETVHRVKVVRKLVK